MNTFYGATGSACVVLPSTKFGNSGDTNHSGDLHMSGGGDIRREEKV